jgi:hypothetical protein
MTIAQPTDMEDLSKKKNNVELTEEGLAAESITELQMIGAGLCAADDSTDLYVHGIILSFPQDHPKR